ncbi:MAG: Acylphosphatase [Phycisphaerae bacterium]|nr:Acylphosphatase [Phycisphaerae bacterium]
MTTGDTPSSSAALPIRRTVFFSGNVQGVGFRATARQIARQFAVRGYVKNLLDGRVELVAEGTPDVVGQFITAVEKTMKGFVEFSTSTDSTARGQFQDFGISY